VLKIYRCLQPGINPEVEMTTFLTETAGFANTPALLGAFDLVEQDKVAGLPGEPTALGVLVAFVQNQGEALTQALDYISRYLEEALLQASAAAPIEPAHANLFFFTLANRLGLRTAQMHRALCLDGLVDPAFAPEPIMPDDIEAWRFDCLRRVRHVFARLEERRPDLPPAARALAETLLTQFEQLSVRIDELLPPAIDAMKTRFHGDYHLGQVLVVQNDYYIIDFEGEPLRPIAERRAKSSPLRDVAAMLRSFDYVAAAGLRQMVEIRPSLRPLAQSSALQWRREASAAFMAGYLAEISGCRSVPADARITQSLIDFFTLDKTIAEIEFELDNRPGWLPIPLAGALELIGVVPGDPTTGATIPDGDSW
jgi:maltose alpha-D-glucosyltransferase / alpha-amylase